MHYRSKLQQIKASYYGAKRWKKALKRQNISYLCRKRNNGWHTTLMPPEVMNFSSKYKETVEFLDEFRKSVLLTAGGRLVTVELTCVKQISIPVSIVLAAEFHRWSLIKKVKLKPKGISQWNPKMVALFNDLGVFKLLGIRNQPEEDEAESFTLSPLESGEKIDGEKIHSLQTRFKNDLDCFSSNASVQAGLIEAIENSISHAYPMHSDYKPKYKYAGHRWWAVSCLDLNSNSLRFFVFDQGAGIPNTLPRSGMWENIVKSFGSTLEKASLWNDEGYILQKAFEVSRTKTGQDERGLGLDMMRKLVETSKDCRFRILSGKGAISFDGNGGIEKFTHSYHIGGTLLEWSFPINIFEDDELDET